MVPGMEVVTCPGSVALGRLLPLMAGLPVAGAFSARRKKLKNALPLDAAGFTALGNFLFGQGRFSEAATYYRDYADRVVDSPKAWNNLGGAYYMTSDFDRAAAAWERSLELRPNRSVIVPRLSREEFDELTELRCHVEAMAASRAVERVGADDLARLKETDAAMQAAATAADTETYLDKNFEFHFLIYRLGASRFALTLIENLWVRVGPLIRYCLDGGGFDLSGRMHAQLIDGLEARNPERLRMAVRSDITSAAAIIRRVCESMSLWP